VVIALIPIFGGVGTIAGPIVGAAVLVPISEYSRVWFSGSGRNVDLLIYGFLIMVIAVYRPNGVISLFERGSLGRFMRWPGIGRPRGGTWPVGKGVEDAS
jgi:branched-chain amino acid transport system permease protein